MEIDKSRKHSVDSDIVNLVDVLNTNSSNGYKTTSSCSGRIIVYQVYLSLMLDKHNVRALLENTESKTKL